MKKMEELWMEEDLIERFHLPKPNRKNEREGRSNIISGWIRKGLKYIEISGIRLFREEDVVDFFNKQFGEAKGDEVGQ
jgi:hypothetical protein